VKDLLDSRLSDYEDQRKKKLSHPLSTYLKLDLCDFCPTLYVNIEINNRPGTCNVILRRVRVTTVSMEAVNIAYTHGQIKLFGAPRQ
jgi:hypothetical protein